MKSRITATVDYDKPGKQLGYLRLVHSDNRHGFGILPVPVAVFANGQGPSVFLSAGNHGDEYDGQAILHRLIRTLDPGRINGRLIIMPALNYPAVLDGGRVSPLDGGNLNRAFPGDPDGTPTFALANYVETTILPLCQAASDLHSGGSSGYYIPCAFLHAGGTRELKEKKIAAARAFGAPFTVVARTTFDHRSLSAACDRNGVLMVATELGGSGGIDRQAMAVGETGLMRFLEHVGVMGGATRDGFTKTRFIAAKGAASSVMVPHEGIFEPACSIGDVMKAGDLVGYVHSIGELDRPSAVLKAPHDGILAVIRTKSLVRRGDYVAHMHVEFDPAELLA